jgi:hypothetical protein
MYLQNVLLRLDEYYWLEKRGANRHGTVMQTGHLLPPRHKFKQAYSLANNLPV